MLHFVEHRIENNMLRAGLNKLLDLLGTFVAAAPDRNPWTEIRVLVTPVEPFPQPSLGSSLIVIDGEINSLTVVEGRGIALRVGEKLANHRRLANKSAR